MLLYLRQGKGHRASLEPRALLPLSECKTAGARNPWNWPPEWRGAWGRVSTAEEVTGAGTGPAQWPTGFRREGGRGVSLEPFPLREGQKFSLRILDLEVEDAGPFLSGVSDPTPGDRGTHWETTSTFCNKTGGGSWPDMEKWTLRR